VPVQVNGKVRGRLTVATGTTDEQLRELALADPQVMKHLEAKTIKKLVVVNGKLVSVVTE
jgi:leucyl-tRNA synthetase